MKEMYSAVNVAMVIVCSDGCISGSGGVGGCGGVRGSCD